MENLFNEKLAIAMKKWKRNHFRRLNGKQANNGASSSKQTAASRTSALIPAFTTFLQPAVTPYFTLRRKARINTKSRRTITTEERHFVCIFKVPDVCS